MEFSIGAILLCWFFYAWGYNVGKKDGNEKGREDLQTELDPDF
jgi:hypothetical protein